MFNNNNISIIDEFLGTNAEVNDEFDYNSFYRAYVISVEDPQHLGRVQIKIPSLHKDVVNSSQYPWAYPACMIGLGYQVGQFILPPVGSIVFVTFEYSSEHRPIYFGGLPTKYAEGKEQSYGSRINMGQSTKVTGDDIPKEYTGTQAVIYKSPSGASIIIDDDPYIKRVQLNDTEGQKIEMVSAHMNDGTIKKATIITIDEDTKYTLDNDGVELEINGTKYTFDKDTLNKLFYLINNGISGEVPSPEQSEHVTVVEEI